MHIAICIKNNNFGDAKVFIITPEGKQFAFVLIILTICEQCIKMFCPFHTERFFIPVCRYQMMMCDLITLRLQEFPLQCLINYVFFSLTLRCCFSFVFEVLYILYNCILLYMVFFFCIRHIMNGCIIFFMLDSQVAKYFSKIFKKHQSG